MDTVSSSRARLVDLLWQLKQAHDQLGDQSEVRFIHFSKLLNDNVYRQEIIDRSAQSSIPAIRKLGQTLSMLNRDGELLHKRSSGHPAGIPLKLNPDIMETVGQQSGSSSQARHAYRQAGILAAIALLATCIALIAWQYAYLLRGETHVSGTLRGDVVWHANQTWVLDGLVFVDADSSLTVEPGTTIMAKPGSALIVTRGGQLYARGKAENPIVFTSGQPVGARRPGDWGGLVLLGNATVNRADATIEGLPESDTRGAFGGNDDSSSCGLIEYTRIEFAGYEFSKDNELNGLTLGGCGSGTIIRNVQVHRGLDDGIEIFGGTVNLKNTLITGAGDDSLDWDMGWRGQVQFLIIEQYPNSGDNGFEGDNSKTTPSAYPRSEPTFYNVTLISPRSRERFHRAMTIRHGSGGHFHNFIVQGFSGETIDIGGADSARLTDTGELSFGNMLINDIGARGLSWFDDEQMDRDDDKGFDERAFFMSSGNQISFGVNPGLPRAATSQRNPEFSPAVSSPARNGAARPPRGEFWDEAADYLGAIRPGSMSTWTDGWTAYPES